MSGANYWAGRERFELVGTLTVSGSTPVVKTFGRDVAIKRFILVTTTAQTVAANVTTIARRAIDNTSSATMGTFSTSHTGSALNQVRYVDVGKPSTSVEASTTPDQYGRTAAIVYNDGAGLIEVLAAQEIVLTPAGSATAGAYEVYAQLQDLGFNPTEHTEVTYTPA